MDPNFDPDRCTPEHVFDGGDLDCGSGLVLLIREAMQQVAPGGVLEMRSREPTVRDDLPPWCTMVGHELLGAANCADDPRTVRYFVRRGSGEAAQKEADALDADRERARAYEWRVRVRAVGDLLAADDGGVIVNLSSVAAQIHFGSNIAYCASKAAIESMTMTLARALAPKVRVVAVAPGVVDTDFTRAWDPAVREAQIAATPLGRFATPEEVSAAILAAIVHFPHTTGAVFPIDGGRPLGT